MEDFCNDEAFQIARETAEVLDRLSSGSYSSNNQSDTLGSIYQNPRNLVKLGKEELELSRLRTRTWELAIARSGTGNRDFKSVLMTIEFEVSIHLAKFLEKTIDPLMRGLKEVLIENSGEICAICQEEMGVAEEARTVGCCHKFHQDCIFRWVKKKACCPVCRFEMIIESTS